MFTDFFDCKYKMAIAENLKNTKTSKGKITSDNPTTQR